MPPEEEMKGGVDNYRSTSSECPFGSTTATCRLGLICFKARPTAWADSLSRYGPRFSLWMVTHHSGIFTLSDIVAFPCPVRVPYGTASS